MSMKARPEGGSEVPSGLRPWRVAGAPLPPANGAVVVAGSPWRAASRRTRADIAASSRNARARTRAARKAGRGGVAGARRAWEWWSSTTHVAARWRGCGRPAPSQ
eukprot:scaffold128501_cov32-Tisochrysis_lutea.AAC.6